VQQAVGEVEAERRGGEVGEDKRRREGRGGGGGGRRRAEAGLGDEAAYEQGYSGAG